MRKRVLKYPALHTEKFTGIGNDRRPDKIAGDAFVGPAAKYFRSYRTRHFRGAR